MGRSRIRHCGSASLTTKAHRDGLSNPPRCIRGEREPLGDIKPLDCGSEALFSESDPLGVGETDSSVSLGQRGHDPTMRNHESCVGIKIAVLSQGYKFAGFRACQLGSC